MKYEVIIFLKDCVINSWRFRTINQVCKFIENTNCDLVDVRLFRIPDFKEFDVDNLMEIWRC